MDSGEFWCVLVAKWFCWVLVVLLDSGGFWLVFVGWVDSDRFWVLVRPGGFWLILWSDESDGSDHS
jgi:hypothetical protein